MRSPISNPFIPPLIQLALLDRGMGFRQAHDACRASAQTPACSGADTTRAWSWKDQIGKPREETGTRYQEKRQKRPDRRMQDPSQRSCADEKVWLDPGSILSPCIFADGLLSNLHLDIFKSSTPCARNYKLFPWGYRYLERPRHTRCRQGSMNWLFDCRQFEATSKWCSRWRALPFFSEAWTDRWTSLPYSG